MKKILYAAMSFAPVLALAQVGTIDTTATSLANTFTKVINTLIPAFFGLAIIYFFYGVAKYILAAGDPKAADAGKSIMIYGIIAIAVMASIYGIVNFLTTSLGINNSATPSLPVIPTR